MDNSAKRDVSDKFELPTRYKDQTLCVWLEYAALAAIHRPINLGLGYPDFPPPKDITDALEEIIRQDKVFIHQYTRAFGHMRLVRALAQLYSKLIGRAIDPESEILISTGAFGSLFTTISAHVDVGDEVIVIEPAFDCYEPMVKACGGVPVFVPLRSNTTSDTSSSADWVLDPEELKRAFNLKTKAIIINNPNNPLGKVFTEEELLSIAQLCQQWNVLCISDEVYEWLVYKPKKHIRIASLPGMWERTITIGSAGKTFSVTGWKLGWSYGPQKLIHNLQIVHQNCIYTSNTPLQEALAIGFERETNRLGEIGSSFTALLPTIEATKNIIIKLLTDIGVKPIIPEAGYFILADCSSLVTKVDLSTENDQYFDSRLTKWLTKNVGVQLIPCSVFYGEKHKSLGEHLIRICFIKEYEKLEAASIRLKKWRASF